MDKSRINSELHLYNKDLGVNSYKGSFPFSTDGLEFDIEQKVTTKIKILNNNNYHLDFNDVVYKDDYIIFTYQGFKYFGKIDSYSINDDKVSTELIVSLNYDALDYEITELVDLTDESINDYPGDNEIFGKAGGYIPKKGLAGLLLLYAKKGLEYNIPFKELSPCYTLSDLTDNEYTYDDIFEDINSFSELVRYAHKVAGIRLDFNMSNKQLDNSEYDNLPIPIRDDVFRFCNCITSEYEYIPLEIDERNNNHVIGGLEKSFQDDRPNVLELDVYNTNDGEEELIASETFVLCIDGIVRNVKEMVVDQMPVETVYEHVNYSYDLNEITENVMLAYAISIIGNNYANEISFKTTRKILGMEENRKSIYNFYDVLGKPVVYYTSSSRAIFTRITAITVTDDDYLNIKLGASRQSLTSKIKKIRRR